MELDNRHSSVGTFLTKEHIEKMPSPSFVVSELLLRKNLEILKSIADTSGAKILLALKAFSMHSLGSIVSEYLNGVCASGIWEAKLGQEFFQGEIHSYSPAYKVDEFIELSEISDHLSLNSISQWDSLSPFFVENCSYGLRINPEISQADVELYDPCSPKSRLGVLRSDFDDLLEGQAFDESDQFKKLEGLHFHALCEQGANELKKILDKVSHEWADVLSKVQYVNFGGGHHITHDHYDRDLLIQVIQDFSKLHQVEVYLEPGEAIAVHSGWLVSEVLDVIENERGNVIVDVSATCHMPDILEMPYRPGIIGGYLPGEKEYSYRIGGVSCLAGDVMGEWSFDHPLNVGDIIIFDDMLHYTMVKSTTFNGVKHPAIVLLNKDDSIEVLREFTYSDFKNKLS